MEKNGGPSEPPAGPFANAGNPRDGYKILWMILVSVIFIISVLAFLFWAQIKNQLLIWNIQFFKNPFPGLSTTLPAKPTTNPIRMSEGEEKANLFIAELDYNPANGQVAQLKVEKQQGPQPWPLPAQLPKEGVSPSMFAYKIEVWNLKQEITYSGWVLGFKKIMRTDKGNLKLNIMVPYQQNSFVKVYLLDDKLIWTGKMD